jgi:hypothetical protein
VACVSVKIHPVKALKSDLRHVSIPAGGALARETCLQQMVAEARGSLNSAVIPVQICRGGLRGFCPERVNFAPKVIMGRQTI